MNKELKESNLSSLPNLPKEEVESPDFNEAKEKEPETSRTLWIIIFAFAILASISVLVWFIFSGRADQKIHGDNLAALTGENKEKAEETSPSEVVVTDRNIDLSDYDSDITLTESGEYTLTGILNASIKLKADSEIKLNLSGVTISSNESPSILNDSNVPLKLSLVENKINSLTSILSHGDLTVENSGSLNGRLISSGINSLKKLIINGGLIYLNGDKVSNSLKVKDGLEINGGTVIALSKEKIDVELLASSQKSLVVDLTEEIKEGSDFTIRATATGSSRRLDRVETSFNSIVYSASDLASGDYEILVDNLVVGTGTVK